LSSSSRTRAFAALLAATLLAALAPLAAVSADNSPGGADNLVVLAFPRQAVAGNAGVVMSSVGGLFVFDFELHDGSGAPFPVTDYVVDLNSIHGDGGSNPDAPAPAIDLIYTTHVHLDAPASTGTVRVPASLLSFAGPFDGVTFTLSAVDDANGQYLCGSDGICPSGSFSLAANAAAAQGDWKDADLADEGFSPIFTVDGEPTGLVQPGNPLLNAGFELGHSDGGYESVDQPGASGFKTAIAPWHLILNKPDVVDQSGSTPAPGATLPASFHHVGYEDGSNGAYVDIEYNAADDGKDLIFGQYLSAPTAQSAWVGGPSVKACFDARFYDAAGVMDHFYLQTNVWGAGDAHSTQPGYGGIDLPADAAWHHYCMDFGNQLQGKSLNEFFFNLYYGTSYGESQPSHPSAQPHVQLDSVVLSGATLQQGVSTRTDLSDGYSVFIQPANSVVGDAQQVHQLLTPLAGGKSAYVYDISSMDYTGISPKSVDVAASPNVLFELLDQRALEGTFAPGGSPTSGLPPYGTDVFTSQPANVYHVLAADGSVSDHVLVVADPAKFHNAAGGDPAPVPWAFVQQTPDSVYTTVYGTSSEPSSGYYSPARNAVAGWSVADAMDYQFTPLPLATTLGASLASPATLTLSCPAASSGSTCAASSNSFPVLTATLSTASRVLETVNVRLVSATDPAYVVCGSCSRSVATPGGSVSFSLTPSDLSALLAHSGSYNVKAVSDAGTFVEAASSPSFGLDNVFPTAAFTATPTSGVTRLTTLAFADASHDPDGYVVSRSWSVELPDHSVTGMGQQGANATSVSYKPTMLGDYVVTLTIQDNGGATVTHTAGFHVDNVAPSAKIVAPAAAGPGVVAFDATGSVDPDGALSSASFLFTTDGATYAASPDGARLLVAATDDGPVTVGVMVTDADGATSFANATTLVDAEAPTTTLTLSPDSGSWQSAPVSYTVDRSDAGPSGLARTVLVVDGKSTNVPGSSRITGSLGDGTHTIQAFSVDNAGNVETAAPARVVKVDTTPPTASFQDPTFAGPIGGAYVAGEQVPMDVAATDDGAPVLSVSFAVDGQVVCVDSTVADGFSCTLDTTGMMAGMHQLQATATNAAGLSTATSAVTIVIGPGAPSVPDVPSPDVPTPDVPPASPP